MRIMLFHENPQGVDWHAAQADHVIDEDSGQIDHTMVILWNSSAYIYADSTDTQMLFLKAPIISLGSAETVELRVDVAVPYDAQA